MMTRLTVEMIGQIPSAWPKLLFHDGDQAGPKTLRRRLLDAIIVPPAASAGYV